MVGHIPSLLMLNEKDVWWDEEINVFLTSAKILNPCVTDILVCPLPSHPCQRKQEFKELVHDLTGFTGNKYFTTALAGSVFPYSCILVFQVCCSCN